MPKKVSNKLTRKRSTKKNVKRGKTVKKGGFLFGRKSRTFKNNHKKLAYELDKFYNDVIDAYMAQILGRLPNPGEPEKFGVTKDKVAEVVMNTAHKNGVKANVPAARVAAINEVVDKLAKKI